MRVWGGYFVFESEEALKKWKATPIEDLAARVVVA